MTARLPRRHRPPHRCPCCGHAGGFCDAHRTLLARIRGELDGVKKLASVGNGGRKKAGPPRCCMPGCYEPRGLGERFCLDHDGEDDE